MYPDPPIQNPGNAKVTQLNHARLCEENILRLYVSVQDLPVVDMLEAQTNLDKPAQYLHTKIVNLLTTQANKICHHELETCP